MSDNKDKSEKFEIASDVECDAVSSSTGQRFSQWATEQDSSGFDPLLPTANPPGQA